MIFKVGDKVNAYHGSLRMPTKLIITEIKDNGILKGKCIINGDLWLANPKQCRKLVKKWEIGNRGKFINKQSDWFGKKFTVIKSYGNTIEVNFDNTKNNPYTILKRLCRKLIKKKIDWKIDDRGIYKKNIFFNEKFTVIHEMKGNAHWLVVQFDCMKGKCESIIEEPKFCKKLKKKGKLVHPEIVSSNEAIKKAFEYMTANKKIRRSSDDLIMQDCGDPFKWNLETDKYGVMNFKTCWKCGNFFTNEHPSSNEVLATDPPKYQHSECPKVKPTEEIKVTYNKTDYEILPICALTFNFPDPKIETIENLKKENKALKEEIERFHKLQTKWINCDQCNDKKLEQIECMLCDSTGMFVNIMEGAYKKCPSCKGTKKLWRKK